MPKYASTLIKDGIETIVVVLPLSEVEAWDPDDPPEGTYLVDDEVQAGWEADGEGGWLPPPPPPPPLPPLPTLGELLLESADSGELIHDGTELNAHKGQRVTVRGRIARGGETLTHVAPGVPLSMPVLRLPLMPTDVHGRPLLGAQPSMVVASIAEGIVTATWVPEFTGTFAVTAYGVNVRLADGQKLKFNGLGIFVLPPADEWPA